MDWDVWRKTVRTTTRIIFTVMYLVNLVLIFFVKPIDLLIVNGAIFGVHAIALLIAMFTILMELGD